ncbi:phytoene/squalene synthase family protein [Bacillus sp. DJP31]|uniref:phytoene/squalene synthase family protein n=1 Tax=Bacillus sp. DJP31 TaxID=3409789 RepID=UPI003BB563FA
MSQLAKAYQVCEGIVSQHSKTFYKAFTVLPSKEKKAVWAVYAFCRSVDDIVDEGENPEQQLQEFKMTFDQFVVGSLQTTDLRWIALRDVFDTYEMDVEPFYEMIKGQEQDLTKVRFETIEEVLQYSYYVASSVGLMLLPILAPANSHKLRDGAIYLGQAMQITNILRDIGEDFERGRVYMPRDIMAKHQYSFFDIKHQVINSSFISLWEEMASVAEELYEEVFKTIDEYPLYSRTPVKGAAYLYRAILGSVRRNKYQVFKKKNFVSLEEKIKIMSSVLQ